MEKLATKIALLLFLSISLWGKSAIEVVKSVKNFRTIAVEDGSMEKEVEKLSPKFYRLLINDLTILTYFDVKDTGQKTEFEKNGAEFENRNLDYILKYKLYYDDLDNLSADIKFINNQKGNLIFVKKYKIVDSDMYPFLAHKVVADVNTHFGVNSVDWLTKYIIFARYTKPRESEIVIADYTLTYMKTLVSGGLNLFPKWADKAQKEFYFTRYEENKPTLYKMNIRTGNLEKILQTDGMLACSDVSPDGKELLLTMAPNGQPDIYLYNIETKSKKQLTSYGGIDVSAHFIEGGKRITFVSDRLGFPNIFAKSIREGDESVEQE